MAPEERDLRGVVSYQARIPVERDGEIYLIEVSLPDWEEDRVILRGLASRYGRMVVGRTKRYFGNNELKNYLPAFT
jgi:hypothetical protein